MKVQRIRGYVLKRPLDLVLALLGIMVLGLPMLLVALLIRIKLGKPVLFRQERAGLAGRSFQVIKFRSMTNDTDDSGELLPDDQRLPAFGKFLRSSSIDELPELLNVIKGEMSLVGPRPLLVRYLARYSNEQARRHEARPGLTGWAQVNGRNALNWNNRFELDVWYVDHVSPLLDLRILLLTLVKVIKRSDVSSQTHATMEEFMGNGASN